eukprot:169839_1
MLTITLCLLWNSGISSQFPANLTPISIIELDEHAGRFTQIRIDQSRLPSIVYNNEKYGAVTFVHCIDNLCNERKYINIDANNNPSNGKYISMKISPNTFYPQFTYSEQTNTSNQSVKIVTCYNTYCSKYDLSILYTGPLTPYESYLMYIYNTPYIAVSIHKIGVQLFICNNINCSNFKGPISLNRNDEINTRYPSIALPSIDTIAFTYYRYNNDSYSTNQTYGNLECILCDNLYCNNSITYNVIDGNFSNTKMNIGEYSYGRGYNGYMVNVYVHETNGFIKYSVCNINRNFKCNISIIDNNVGVNVDGVYPEIDQFELNGIQTIFVSWYRQINDDQGGLMFMQCNNVLCEQYVKYFVNGTVNGYGRDSSMAVSNNSILYISFLDFNGDGTNKKARLTIYNITYGNTIPKTLFIQ